MLPPILLAGPTASGKSALAMALAEEVDGVVINADALQVYDCWRVLSARPSPEDEARVSHALYGHVPALRAHSVGDWLREVAPYLAGARRAVICGGTGLYFTALTQGLAEIPPIPDEVRQAADAIRTGAGPERFRTDLAAQDPVTLAGLDARNPMRLQRAWEVLRATGRGLAAWQADTPPPLLPLDHSVPLVLETPVGWLDARIAHRFAAMLDAGAEDEVAAWEASRLPAHLPAAQAIGRGRDLGDAGGRNDARAGRGRRDARHTPLRQTPAHLDAQPLQGLAPPRRQRGAGRSPERCPHGDPCRSVGGRRDLAQSPLRGETRRGFRSHDPA